MKRLMCAVVVAASFLLSSDKNKIKYPWRGHDFVVALFTVCGDVLKCSNVIPSIDKDIFPLYYSYFI